MKKLAIILSAIVLVAGISTTSCAQKNEEKKKEKKVRIKLEKEVDGKLTKIDTVFILKDGESLKDVLKEYDIDVKEFKKGDLHTWSFHKDDEGEEGKVVKKILIEIDEDGKHKIKSKKAYNMMYISEEGGEHDITIDIDENDDVHIIRKHDLHFISEHSEEESWRKDAKPGDTVRIKTIVSINGKETIKEKEIIVSEDDLKKRHKNVFIHKGDKKGKHKNITKKIIISDDDVVEWNDSDENIFIFKEGGKTKKIKIEIDDLDKDDLKKLKLPKSIKPLKVNDLFIMFNKDDKMTLSFNIADKANTSIKIFDEYGKVLFEDTKSNFSGKYSKEIKKMKGEMIIQISQGKKYFHKELEIEY